MDVFKYLMECLGEIILNIFNSIFDFFTSGGQIATVLILIIVIVILGKGHGNDKY